METKATLVDMVSPALEKYAALQVSQGKTQLEAMEKIMMYIVDFAANKIPKGSKEKLMALMTQVATRRKYARVRKASGAGNPPGVKAPKRVGAKQTKSETKWRGTYAARLVWKLNYQGARTMPSQEFYKKVNLFVNRRVFALNLHRSGLYPAMKALKSRRKGTGKLPEYKAQPGSYSQRASQGIATMLAENWASAKGGDGIAKLKGDAFDLAVPQVEKMMRDWYNTDIKKLATSAGLTVKTT